MRNKQEIFLELYESNRDRIYRICHYYVPNKGLVNDLFQDIFLNVWKNIDSFRNEAKINTWIYRIAINTSISFARFSSNERDKYKNMEEAYYSNIPDQEESNEDTEMLFKLLYQGIAQLPIVDRTIISLFLEDLSYKEIAEISKISEDNLRVRIHRIKKKLKIFSKD